ncbi:MAG: hypothetical protein M3292_06580 [Actinomycetota bacterium]|nr:hypothetical protein [Actinomycetota bacterium]
MKPPLPGRHPLERLLAPLEPVALDDHRGSGAAAWLRSDEWRLFVRLRRDAARDGEEIQRFSVEGGGTISATWSADRGVFVPFSLAEAYENYVSERWRTRTRRKELSPGQLSLFYRVKPVIPRRLQLAGRRILVRWQGLPEFPAWPVDESVVRLVQFYARCLLLASAAAELRFRWFWPESYAGALVLTHDVETAEGLRLALEIADLEEERGLRSSFNLVASSYPIDDGVLRELRGRGFELGVHGLYHDRSLFSGRAAFEAQQPALRKAVELLGAEGFRSPATHRVFEWLGELPVSYDCSMPHSDPFEPQPGGCCSLWPFFIGNVVELPYTLPQDHTLFTLLRHRSIDLWLAQLERIERLHGLAQVLTHPDPGYLGDPRNRRRYEEFLDAVRDRRSLWRPLPRDVAAWWRQRDTGASGRWRISTGSVRLAQRDAAIELRPPSGRESQAAYL